MSVFFQGCKATPLATIAHPAGMKRDGEREVAACASLAYGHTAKNAAMKSKKS